MTQGSCGVIFAANTRRSLASTELRLPDAFRSLQVTWRRIVLKTEEILVAVSTRAVRLQVQEGAVRPTALHRDRFLISARRSPLRFVDELRVAPACSKRVHQPHGACSFERAVRLQRCSLRSSGAVSPHQSTRPSGSRRRADPPTLLR